MKIGVLEKILSLRTKNTSPMWANEMSGFNHKTCFGSVFRLQSILKLNGN